MNRRTTWPFHIHNPETPITRARITASGGPPLAERLDARQARDRGDHQAGEELHGCHVAVVKGVRRSGENFEYAQGSAEMAKRCRKNRARAKAAAAGQIDQRVSLGIVTKDDLAGADTIGGDSRVGLQANSEIRRGAAGAGPADDFVSVAQSDGGAGGSGQSLGALRNHADGGLKIDLAGMNIKLVAGNMDHALHRVRTHGSSMTARGSERGKRSRNTV